MKPQLSEALCCAACNVSGVLWSFWCGLCLTGLPLSQAALVGQVNLSPLVFPGWVQMSCQIKANMEMSLDKMMVLVQVMAVNINRWLTAHHMSVKHKITHLSCLSSFCKPFHNLPPPLFCLFILSLNLISVIPFVNVAPKTIIMFESRLLHLKKMSFEDGFGHLWSLVAILSRWSHVTWETLQQSV